MASLTWAFSLLAVLLLVFQECSAQEGFQCARECHEVNCDTANIRYGKYCGVGHGGCKGEPPCDAVDACCKRHDTCVEKAGMFSANQCHKDFIQCIDKHKGGSGFSTTCPYDLVIPTMRNGIELAMALTSMFGGSDQDSEF